MNQVESNLLGQNKIVGDTSIERKLANIPPQIVRQKCLFTAHSNPAQLQRQVSSNGYHQLLLGDATITPNASSNNNATGTCTNAHTHGTPFDFMQTKLNIAAAPFVAPQNHSVMTVDSPRMEMPMYHHRGEYHYNDGMWPYNTHCASCQEEPSMAMMGNGMPMDYMQQPKMVYREPDVGPILIVDGAFQIRLNEGIQIDMTFDKSIRVTNSHHNICVSLSNSGNAAALNHPNGRVYQYGHRVEMVVYDGTKRSSYVRYAKMWQKGISFTRNNCPVIYLVDSAGTRTTTDTFLDLTKDYVGVVFNGETGDCNYPHPMSILHEARVYNNPEGTEMIELNGFKISQTADGLVRVTRNNNNKCLIRTSPANGSVTLTTPGLHCTASMGQTPHLFVRHGERRMHFDGSVFVVRNAGHSAGFEENNLLKVY